MKEEFISRVEHFKAVSAHFSKRHSFVAVLRTLLFLFGFVSILYFANEREYMALLVIVMVFPLPFGLLVNYHNKIAYKRDQASYVSRINNEEVIRLNGELKSFNDGVEFAANDHYYTSDLDVFGKNSLFQLVNRSTTPSGEDKLASWFKSPAEIGEIHKRQEAIKELTPLLEWRQDFQASGMHNSKENSLEKLFEWLGEGNRILNPKINMVIAIALSIITLLTISAALFFDIPFSFAGLSLLLNALFSGKYLKYSTEISQKVSRVTEQLKSYVSLISIIQKTDFKADKLLVLKSSFEKDGRLASEEIKKLEKLLDHFYRRQNPFYALFSIIFTLDIHRLIGVEKWRERNKENIQLWFGALGEMEALCGFSAYGYANPQTVFPTVTDKPFELTVNDIGHPLIKSENRITNDFEMSGAGAITLITGSNMSGKSTFLRTIGVNIVLGLAGGPLCASNAHFSRVQLFTGMRSADDLDEGISSFYAELKRIQLLLKLVNESEIPVMFMLDEILKGTNSKDRHKGAEALVKQLSGTRSYGFVSTHDLELSKLENELVTLKNSSFNSSIEGDEIIFDYKIADGACHSFNASELMKKIGIEIS